MNSLPKLGIQIVFLFSILSSQCKKSSQNETSKPAEPDFIKFDGEKSRYVAAKGGLRLRTEPNSDSKVIVLIPECSHVFQGGHTKKIETIDGLSGPWAKLRYVGPKSAHGEGWGFEPYLAEELPELRISKKNLTNFKSGCLNITGEGPCMGCGSIEFFSNGKFSIAYDCHLFGDGTWRIDGDRILVESSQYIGGCGHFTDPEACSKAPEKPKVYYEFKVSDENSWSVKTNSAQWRSKDYLDWSKEWNNVGKMRCLVER